MIGVLLLLCCYVAVASSAASLAEDVRDEDKNLSLSCSKMLSMLEWWIGWMCPCCLIVFLSASVLKNMNYACISA